MTDELAVIIEQLVEHMADVEVMDTGECPDDDTRDLWFRQAIMELKNESCAAFVSRGGRIPAPIHSLRN